MSDAITIRRLSAILVTLCAIAPGAASATAATVPDAMRTYASYCANCHGRWGKGDGPAAVVLKTKPGDLGDPSRMSKLSDEKLFIAIKDGGPAVGMGRDMPGWGEGLSDDQIRALVAFIRGLSER